MLARNPGHIDAHLLLAEVDLLDKRPEDALKHVDEALRLQPGNARAFYTKGLVLDSIGQTTGAMSYYEQAARAEPENEMYALCCKKIKDTEGSEHGISNAVVLTAGQGPLNSDNKVIPSANGQGPFLASPADQAACRGQSRPSDADL